MTQTDGICKVEGCGKQRFRRELCSMHYSRFQRYGNLDAVHKPGEPRSLGPCSAEGCNRDAVARDLCGKHYQRWKKFSDPLVTKLDRDRTDEERFWAFVDKSGPCWLWTGGTSDGYGIFSLRGKSIHAHRFAWMLTMGPPPGRTASSDGEQFRLAEQYELDHLCRVRRCCNPSHLERVPSRINKLRGTSPSAANATKVKCPKGHDYDDENTYVDGQGRRHCRTCQNQRSLDWYYRNKSRS